MQLVFVAFLKSRDSFYLKKSANKSSTGFYVVVRQCDAHYDESQHHFLLKFLNHNNAVSKLLASQIT
jgi:hypothetical protein